MKLENIATTLIFVFSIHGSSSSSSGNRQNNDDHGNSDKIKKEDDIESFQSNNRKFSDFRNINPSKDDPKDQSESGHSRQKRFLWITDDGRLALPPGTVLTITPTLGLPFVRYPPEGFFSNISISLPLTSKF